MPVFQTAAFLQQCFAVHPLALSVKKVGLPEMVGVLCVNCRLRHRLTVGEPKVPSSTEPGETGCDLREFRHCVQGHPEDIRVALVDVDKDSVLFRCRSCCKGFPFSLRLCETHQS